MARVRWIPADLKAMRSKERLRDFILGTSDAELDPFDKAVRDLKTKLLRKQSKERLKR